MSAMRSLSLILIFLFVSVAIAVENGPTEISPPLAPEATQQIAEQIGVVADADLNPMPTKVPVNQLPELPGSELLGVGVNLKLGFGMEAMTRPLLRARSYSPFYVDSDMAYRIPKFQTPRLNFAADMTVKVFNSAAERAESMALSVGVAVTAGPVDLDLKMSMDNSQSSETKTVISEANVGVSLYDLGAFKFSPKDLHPELLSEFNKLPTNWADNPMMFNDFVARWGTHYVKSASIGGSFDMIGTTTTDKSMSNSRIAVAVSFQLSSAVKVKVDVSFEQSKKEELSKFQSRFDFHARGGDPAVGGLLASAHSSGDAAATASAMTTWLQSLKKLPAIRSSKLAYLHELFGIIPGSGTPLRQFALKQATEIFLRETDRPGNAVTIVAGRPEFSNFWRVSNQCLTFQGVVGPDNTLIVYFTASASKPSQLGYQIEINQNMAVLKRAGKEVARTESTFAISPGSSTLFSSYIMCMDVDRSLLMYGRQNRVVMSYIDSMPLPAQFFGFDTRGPERLSLTAMQLFNVTQLQCPQKSQGQCGGPSRGTCSISRQCECLDGFKGYACQFACPVNKALNNAVCSGRGECLLDDPNTDSVQPYCKCPAGTYGPACEYTSLPTIEITAGPTLNNGELMSARPSSFNFKLIPTDATAPLRVLTASFIVTIEESDSDPVTYSDMMVIRRRLNGGDVTVSVTATLPHTPDIITARATFKVRGCTCSGKGRCNPDGNCVCRPGSLGSQCELDVIQGFLSVPPSDSDMALATLKFPRLFARTPVELSLTPMATIEEPDAASNYNVTFDTVSPSRASLSIKRVVNSTIVGWATPVKVSYRAVGLRLVGRSAGTLDFGVSNGAVMKTLQIKFPVPYTESPYVGIRQLGGPKHKAPRGEFSFRVTRVSMVGATIVATLDEGEWDSKLEAKWEARPLGDVDTRQKGVKPVEPRKKGPAVIVINFPQVYRVKPVFQVVATVLKRPSKKLDYEPEVYDTRVLDVDQGRALVQVCTMREEDEGCFGWKRAIKLSWNAYPAGFDIKALQEAQNAVVLSGTELAGDNLGAPVPMSPFAAPEDCAMVCQRNPQCRAFVFFHPASGKNDCAAPANPPKLLGVSLQSGQIVTKSAGSAPWVASPTDGSVRVRMTAAIALKDGRMIGVGADKSLYIRNSVAQSYSLIPASCCVQSVLELADGTLMGVSTAGNLMIKSTLSAPWQSRVAPKPVVRATQAPLATQAPPPSSSAGKQSPPSASAKASPLRPSALSTLKKAVKQLAKKVVKRGRFIEMSEQLESEAELEFDAEAEATAAANSLLATSALPSSFSMRLTGTSFLNLDNNGQIVLVGHGVALVAVPIRSSENDQQFKEYRICVRPDEPAPGADPEVVDAGKRCLTHSGGAIFFATNSANAFNFAWQLRSINGDKTRVMLWSPFPGDKVGRFVKLAKGRLTVLASTTEANAAVFSLVAGQGPAAGKQVPLSSFASVAQLPDHSLIAVGIDSRMYTHSWPSGVTSAVDILAGLATFWTAVGDHSCCVASVAIDPTSGDAFGVTSSGDTMRMGGGFVDPWQPVDGSQMLVQSVSVITPRALSSGSLVRTPAMCQLKSGQATHRLVPNTCAATGTFVKSDAQGKPTQVGTSFAIRTRGFSADKCNGNGLEGSVSFGPVVLSDEAVELDPRPLMRGLNVFLVGVQSTDSAVTSTAVDGIQWAQSDLISHEAIHERGGGDAAVLALLNAAADAMTNPVASKTAKAVVVVCHLDCAPQWTSDISAALEKLGSKAFGAVQIPSASAKRSGAVAGQTAAIAFVKNLNSGEVLEDTATPSNACAALQSSGTIFA